MLKISAPNIEQALLKASVELNCSCVDLEYEVVQYPSNGIFGIGKKEAKIIASLKSNLSKQPTTSQSKKYCFDEILEKISSEINELFSLLPFELDKIEVKKYDSNTILLHFKGKDSALLIGEKGYRYKAISYLLFNWINSKYGLNTRLEIESFLASQENMIANYLEPIITNIKQSNKTFITKPLDGILVYIALKKLRSQFPDRMITIKTNGHNENCIIITQYNESAN
ncbi:MAG: Jag N-terminal domain-containing protein [Helicobacteraceae bacterium]|nr:Jag N-terminal domain-containing protein [Helicobacteraceae bacterium]